MIQSPQQVKIKLSRAVRDWRLYLQLDQDTRKPSPEEDLKYLKTLVKNKLSNHVYKHDGNKPGEYVARCEDHEDC